MTNTIDPILCRIPVAAATLGRGTRFIYEAIATGEIEAVKSGKRTLIVVASLHRYAASLPAAKIKPITRPPRRRRELSDTIT
jgi:excisionase family DNA binding protein